MAGPSVYLTVPSWDVLKFPPSNLPPTLPAPVAGRSFRSPFGIAPWVYNAFMHPAVPFGFATAYILTILYLNSYNRANGNKAWWISKQTPFKAFVVLHNVVLALYSAATFFAMLRAISHTLPDLAEQAGAAGIADALCKLHGPRVLGDAITFNTTINIWESKNQFIKLTGMGNPDPTDVGRLWNEGLAFWGWLFYLSKFYEVLDTFIIVSKGRRSPTLQTYHHAGAMLCMWAGMRYMSPPIWMFVFVNSAIHSMMYVYFALSAMGIRVPQSIKRTLTTLQITQFVWGATYAGLHLFIAYDIPVSTPYKVAAKVAAVASSASSAFVSATSAVSSAVESPSLSGSFGLLVKKLLLRAAGEEGVAERIAIPANTPVAEAIGSRVEEARERLFHQPTFETRYRTELTRVNCIDTSGEAFAIWLNLLYLAPLTILFVRFFIKAYILRSENPKTVKGAAKEIAKDAKIAEAETERAVEAAGKKAEDTVRHKSKEVQKEVKILTEQLNEDVQKMKKGDYKGTKVNERLEKFEAQVQKIVDQAKTQGSQAAKKVEKNVDQAKEQASQAASKIEKNAKNVADKANEQASQAASKVEQNAKSVADDANDVLSDSVTSEPSSGKKKKKNKNKNKNTSAEGDNMGFESKAESEKVSAADEDESTQDANLAESKEIRPGADDDTDAMGKSGVDVA